MLSIPPRHSTWSAHIKKPCLLLVFRLYKRNINAIIKHSRTLPFISHFHTTSAKQVYYKVFYSQIFHASAPQRQITLFLVMIWSKSVFIMSIRIILVQISCFVCCCCCLLFCRKKVEQKTVKSKHYQRETYLFTFFPLADVRSIKALICVRLVRIKPNS